MVVVQAGDQDDRNERVDDNNIGNQRGPSLKFDVHRDVTALDLKLAFPELKTSEFIARPEFL